ncbi:hypothetical protein [Azospirillum rugosum]|uniref:Replication protein n=1 Tax=Azospirillum rugosum TaxID=416170 RepID=A0ABS4SI39_9PROT|nr:hypothetical protein [Azospirillum rugosum]MBP2292236.1 hypothetical protein [Azospirillum rugosum]MDQ0525995.1 hypothetical protein [Azospirillum rugosum]
MAKMRITPARISLSPGPKADKDNLKTGCTSATQRPPSWADRLPLPPVQHDVAWLTKHWKPKERFETADQVRERRDKLVRLLENGENAARRVAKRLKRCKPQRRCGSGACPICGRRFRRWWVGEVLKLLSFTEITDGDNDAVVLSVTLVNRDHRRQAGQLHTLDLRKLIDQYRTQIKRAGLNVRFMVGAVDISFNIDGLKRWEPHWSPHLYLLVNGATSKAIREALERHLIADDAVPRPIRMRTVKNGVKAASYAWKSAFFQRNSFLDGLGRPNTWPYPMKPTQVRELMIYLDRYQPTDRLFLRNVRRHGWNLVPF